MFFCIVEWLPLMNGFDWESNITGSSVQGISFSTEKLHCCGSLEILALSECDLQTIEYIIVLLLQHQVSKWVAKRSTGLKI